MNRFTTLLNRSAHAAVIALGLAVGGCAMTTAKNEAPGPAALDTGLNTQQDRTTDSRILADRRTLEAVQQRLRKLSEAGVGQTAYPLAKAQCWLDTAKSQYHENDRTGYVEESLSEAVKIAQALEADKTAKAGFDTPLVARSTRLRDDLSTQLSAYKNQTAALACNAKTVACAEVRLVRAGHAEEQTGWRQATPHVQMVEDALRQARVEADTCVAPRVTDQAATPLQAASPTVTQPAAAGRETYVLLTDTLFKFGRSGSQDMTPGGMQRLADVAKRLKSYQSIQGVNVVGYTDRLGSELYNNKLSLARAKTVQAYLESLGVKSRGFTAAGKGKSESVSQGCDGKSSRAVQIQCLQPDRRVTIEVTGIAR